MQVDWDLMTDRFLHRDACHLSHSAATCQVWPPYSSEGVKLHSNIGVRLLRIQRQKDKSPVGVWAGGGGGGDEAGRGGGGDEMCLCRGGGGGGSECYIYL